jgi:hypothetical protein
MKKLVYIIRQETLTDTDSGFGRRVRLLLETVPTGLGAGWSCVLLFPFPCELPAISGWTMVSGSGTRPRPAALYQLWRKRLAPLWRLLSVQDPQDWAEFTAALLGIDPWQISALRRGLAREKADVILVSRCDLLPAVSGMNKGRVVVDTNDLLANLLRVYRPREKLLTGLGVTIDELQTKVAWFESAFYRSCIPIAISRDDMMWLESIGCNNPALEDQCVLPQPSERGALRVGSDVVRVGYFGGSHAGSIASGRLFCEVAARLADDKGVQFEVAGKVCDHLGPVNTDSSNNLTLRGKVDRMDAFVAEMDVILLLSVGETGTSVKFQEALFSGTPVIANREAARFEPAVSGVDYTEVKSISEAMERLSYRDWIVPDTAQFPVKYGRAAVSARWRKIIEGVIA